MIIIKLKGGLGNQLFQYACGKTLAIKNNTILKLDIYGLEETSKDTHRKFLLDKFNTSYELADAIEIKKIKYPLGLISKTLRFISFKLLKKYYINFDKNILNLRNNIYLDGFFQSELYFKNIEHIIRKEFTLKDPFSSTAQIYADQIIQTSESVSIHIRRGDYISNILAHKHHGVCNMEYYTQAISYIKEKIQSPTFFIFSDDIEWVKENLNIDQAIYVSNPNLTECEELMLMSYCKHNIIANSTFSWWGAWLNSNPNKIVIAPKKWLNTPIDKQPNIIPKTWIKI